MKQLVILGSTGSIGTQTLDVVRNNPKDFKICALAAGSNIELLEQQILEFHPEVVCVYQEEKAKELKRKSVELGVRILSGMDGLLECATYDQADMVVAAMVGMIGLRPAVAAIEAGKDLALANKETLVTAGHIIMPLVEKYGVKLLPVDSEHSAIFQCLQGNHKREVHKIILTASGGPFLGYKKEELKNITVEDALRHPNWSMGKKITIDSSTMVNKGLEVMEAKWLFGVGYDQIQVVIQPQSVIHSMVEYEDGAVMAQLGTPDMRLPIQYALFYPHRVYLPGERLDFVKMGQITFMEPDMETFRGLKFAYDAGKRGGTMPVVYNAANEYAVARFLEHKIKYTDIINMIEYAMEQHTHYFKRNPDIEDILEAERWTYDCLGR